MNTLITGATVVPVAASQEGRAACCGDHGGTPRYFKGSVALAGNRIAIVAREGDPEGARRIEEFRDRARASEGGLREVDARGKILLPGLVNTHTHAAMTLLRNAADDLPLMRWLRERVWPFEARLTESDIEVGARLGIAEMLLGGTTTFVDMYWHEAAVARAVRDAGVRAVLCPCFVEGRMEEFERDLEETLAAVAECDRLSTMVAPHAAYSCSEGDLRRGVELAGRHGLGMHIHLSETREEQRIISERHGRTPTEYLRDAGVFSRPVIAAHGVYLTDSDMEILRTHGATVAHNPQSNMKLASGAAPVARMLAAGLNVSIGTDGAASNNDLDMWDEMRSAALLGKLTAADPAALPAWQVLWMATAEGARAIGREGELGTVAEGALADLLLVSTGGAHMQPLGDPVAALVYSARASDVESVWVDGREVVSRGLLTELAGIDLAETILAAQATTKSVGGGV